MHDDKNYALAYVMGAKQIVPLFKSKRKKGGKTRRGDNLAH